MASAGRVPAPAKQIAEDHMDQTWPPHGHHYWSSALAITGMHTELSDDCVGGTHDKDMRVQTTNSSMFTHLLTNPFISPLINCQSCLASNQRPYLCLKHNNTCPCFHETQLAEVS
jgi:hypothetical protein